jgi:hypothetical protein
MGSFQSTNQVSVSSEPEYCEVDTIIENSPIKRQGKWVRFSGSDEELAKIALEHAKYIAAKRRPLLKQISCSMSRRNGFNSQEIIDTVCEHWVWSPNNSINDKLQLQAVNCSTCGNYICVTDTNFPLIDRIQCKCHNNYDDGLEEFKEYEYDTLPPADEPPVSIQYVDHKYI